MRTHYQRVLVTLASTALLAAVGVLGGFLFGHAYALRQAELRLDQYADRILLETEASTYESRAMLATMNGSPYSWCSEAGAGGGRRRGGRARGRGAAGRGRGGGGE